MKNVKKFICAGLAVFMLLSAAACGTTQNNSSQEATSSLSNNDTTSKSPDDNIMTPKGKYPETITISVPKSASADPKFADGDTIENNCLTRIMKDNLNIDVKVAWEVEATEYTNKLSLNIASNDLPDAFNLGGSGPDYLIYKQLVENDMLADMTEAYKKCAGDYMQKTFGSVKEKNLEPYTENGKLMGIAGVSYGYEHNLLWVRQDWMKECNLQAPKTLDDVKNIIKTFKEKNMGGKGNVGLIMDPQYPASGNGYAASQIFTSFGAYPRTWIKDNNSKVVYGSVVPEMKQALAVMADWYKQGLLDKQFPTRTASGATDALVKDGQCGVFFAPWWIPYVLFPDFQKNNPKGELIAYNAPLDANGKYNILWPSPSGSVLLVNKKFAHPEAVVKMLNVEFDAWRGIDSELAKLVKPSLDKGTSWGYLFPTGGVNLEFGDCIPNIAYLVKNYIDNGKLEGNPGVFHTEFDKQLAISAKAYKDTMSTDNDGWIQYYGRYFAGSIVNAPEVQIKYPAFSFSTKSMGDLNANLQKLENETMLQIITGEKPVDYFDTFVTDWYKQGGDVITKEVAELVK